MSSLGTCVHRTCDRPAVKVATLTGTHRETGEQTLLEQPVCEEHSADLTRTCDAEGCGGWASNVVPFSGVPAGGGERVESELAMCDDCYARFSTDSTVAIGGITMVHDGSLNFKRVPPTIGRG